MATQLGVGLTTIWFWRNEFNILPGDKFRRNFVLKYGADALESLQAMVERKATLQEIADHFGFSREYSRQVHNKLYGRGRRAQER
jgi:predicted nuclease of restriction endonuclease-like RecB superfamily